jgi:tRNA A37 threonylcarbamoyladenosine biosynthesis protein TsaE
MHEPNTVAGRYTNDYFSGEAMALAGSLEAGEVVFTKHFANSFSLCGVERLAPSPFFLTTDNACTFSRS